MKKIMKAALCMAIVLSMLLSGTALAADATTVTIALYGDANEMNVWNEKILPTINKNLADKNIVAEVLQVPADGWVQYYQKVMAMQAAGTAPDIGRISEFYLTLLSKKNQVMELTDRMGELDMSKYFERSFQGASYQDGKTYGLPSGMYTVVMYFNKDLFDAAGLPYPSQDWENPTPMAEIVDMAAKLTKGSGAEKVYGFACHTSILHLNHFLKGNGGVGLYDPETGKSMMAADPLNLEIYKAFEQMCVVDKSMVTTSDSEIITAIDLFHEGRLAMYVDGTWNQARVKTVTDFTPGIAAVPGKAGLGNSTSFLDQYVIYNGSKNKDAAWEVLKQIESEEVLSIIAENSLYGVTIARNVLDATLKSTVGEIFDQTDIDVYLQSIEKMLVPPYTMAYSEVNPKAVAVLTQLMLGNMNAEDAAKTLDQTLDTANAEEY